MTDQQDLRALAQGARTILNNLRTVYPASKPPIVYSHIEGRSGSLVNVEPFIAKLDAFIELAALSTPQLGRPGGPVARLPELPEPAFTTPDDNLYTPHQMRAYSLEFAAQLPAGVADVARNFLLSNDLYSLLTDIQNGIDSPATRGIANSLICRLDKVRELLATPQPDSKESR